MAGRHKADFPIAILMRPPGNRFRAVILAVRSDKAFAVNVFAAHKNGVRIFIKMDKVLFIGDYEIVNSGGDRMVRVGNFDFKRPNRRVSDKRASEYLSRVIIG